MSRYFGSVRAMQDVFRRQVRMPRVTRVSPGKEFPMSVPPFVVAPLAVLLVLLTGCQQQRSSQPRSDQQLMTDVQARIQSESALGGQDIHVAVSNGIVTLSGTSLDAASRALAGNDAGFVPGVKAVVNNLEVLPPGSMAASSQPPRRPEPVAAPHRHQRPENRRQAKSEIQTAKESAPLAPAAAPRANFIPAPNPPPRPEQKTVTLAAGSVISVRITESLNSENAQPNQAFQGALAGDLVRDGVTVIAQGTPVHGRVVEARSAARFKGSSLLTLELTRIDMSERKIAIVTNTFSKQGAGRGKNTAEKVGGGAVLGAVIGAIAGGGKGAAIGAAAGAGTGAGVNAVSRGEQVQISSESLLNFTLQQPLSITVPVARSQNVLNQAEASQSLQH